MKIATMTNEELINAYTTIVTKNTKDENFLQKGMSQKGSRLEEKYKNEILRRLNQQAIE